MPRPKKDGRMVNLYLNRELVERLEKYCEEVGQTKTIALERSIKKYLDDFDKEKAKKDAE